MSIYVKDALEFDLLDGLTLTGTGTVTGTAAQVDWPQEVTFCLFTGTTDGTTPTLTVRIEGCETADFSTADVVSYGSLFANDDDQDLKLTTRVTTKYVRAVAVKGGTSPDFSEATLAVRGNHYHRTALNTSAPLS